ncbi:glycerophosphodiester phosphodiesterase [Romboutsia sp.]|uniref:glycerophosphodiester phosphodiesterase n=1 Tax=Romboutsia sp. TaxID=1965302 RepID=UPI003F33EB63
MKNKKLKIISSLIIVLAIIIVCSYTYMTNGEKYNGGLQWLTDRPIAHRGLFNETNPENSIAAFKNSIENNYAIELDAQFTKDKEVVVFHDDNLERMTGNTKDVSELEYMELKELKLNNSNESIPLLKDVLKVVGGKVPILIEIKDCKNIKELGEATYKITQNYKGKYAVQSFNPFVLEWYKKNASEVARGQLSGTFSDEKGNLKSYEIFLLKNIMLNFKSRPNFMSYELSGLPNSRVEQLRNKDIPIISWTIRNKDDLKKAYKYSDNIIFDNMMP